MDNPQQVLLHLTSRGTNVRTRETGQVGRFTNLTTQPINNINKYGLLHYSIPKTMDLLDYANRKFNITIEFRDGNSITIDVTLPDMDYYNVALDHSGADNVPHFTEILQTSINWAIQKHWTKNKAAYAQNPLEEGVGRGAVLCNRLGCMVKLTDMGRLQFVFGWRGEAIIRQDVPGANPGFVRYYKESDIPNPDNGTVPVSTKVKIQPNTGSPIQNLADPTHWQAGFRGAMLQGSTHYDFIDTNGDRHRQIPPALTNQQAWEQTQLKSVSFIGLSTRLQFLLGASGANLKDDRQLYNTWVGVDAKSTTETARICQSRNLASRVMLVNYLSAHNNNRTHMIDFTMPVPPNLYAPSFMFLQLIAQGTKSKVLGHSAERGGWAVPTASNQFKSKYDNFPNKESLSSDWQYDSLDVRQCPALLNMSIEQREEMQGTEDTGEHFMGDDGNMIFDRIPFDPYGVCFIGPDDYGNPVHWEELHNFSLKGDDTLNTGPDEADLLQNHRFGSRMVHYGDMENYVALATKRPRSMKQFGLSQVKEAPCFTVSMIDPNWIYTDVPNSTVQSVDVLLMWGDTNKNVEEVSGFPVQFTMIASQ